MLSQCCQDSLRVHLRKAYHKYVEEKQGKGMAFAFDTFLEEMIDYMDNQVQEEDEAMGTGPRGYLVWVPEEDSEEESKEAEKVAEELMPNVPEYKDGSLDPSFWEEHWNLFKQCGVQGVHLCEQEPHAESARMQRLHESRMQWEQKKWQEEPAQAPGEAPWRVMGDAVLQVAADDSCCEPVFKDCMTDAGCWRDKIWKKSW